MVVTVFGCGDVILLANLAFVVDGYRSSIAAGLLVGDAARDVNNLGCDAVSLQILLNMKVTFRPFACWGVWAKKKHADSGRNNKDKGNDEGHAPCNMGSQVLT